MELFLMLPGGKAGYFFSACQGLACGVSNYSARQSIELLALSILGGRVCFFCSVTLFCRGSESSISRFRGCGTSSQTFAASAMELPGADDAARVKAAAAKKA